MGRTQNELKDIIAHKLTQNLNVWTLKMKIILHNMEFICIDVLEWQCNIFEVNVSNDTHLSNFRSTDIKITDLRKQFSKVQEQTNEEREKKMA